MLWEMVYTCIVWIDVVALPSDDRFDFAHFTARRSAIAFMYMWMENVIGCTTVDVQLYNKFRACLVGQVRLSYLNQCYNQSRSTFSAMPQEFKESDATLYQLLTGNQSAQSLAHVKASLNRMNTSAKSCLARAKRTLTLIGRPILENGNIATTGKWKMTEIWLIHIFDSYVIYTICSRRHIRQKCWCGRQNGQ